MARRSAFQRHLTARPCCILVPSGRHCCLPAPGRGRRTAIGMSRVASCATLFILLAAVTPTGASCQFDQTARRHYAVQPQFGIDAIYLIPADTASDLGESAAGIQVSYRQPLDALGLFAFRLDAGVAGLGGYQTTVTERVGSYRDSPTTIRIAHHLWLLEAGVQLQSPRGLLRPYVGVRGGLARIGTSVYFTRRADYNIQPQDSLSGPSDNTVTYGAFGGALLVLSAGGAPVFLNVGVRLTEIGEVQTQLISGVRTNADGRIEIYDSRVPRQRHFVLVVGVTLTRG